ncbi:hypothetical protein [Paractinoplanes hotanensis]|uniref:Uncharacterized protein n=1 Tax=Paractinoplanes hotanensis TaxID=2906497 RepID=A0ABT0XWT4_9ACTN|nr:hypothetical protein [Actinoplanes hotanensis]MCM4078246.1 hypothetical protein [Actinoplanes hotanensis]
MSGTTERSDLVPLPNAGGRCSRNRPSARAPGATRVVGALYRRPDPDGRKGFSRSDGADCRAIAVRCADASGSSIIRRLGCLYAPHAYGGCLAGNKKLLILPLIIHNPAPAPLAVVNARLLLHPKAGGTTTVFYWHAIQTAITGVNETRVFASPFAVEGRRAVEKFLEFQCNRPEVKLDDGPYTAIVEVRVEPSRGKSLRWSTLVTFTLNTQFITGAREALLQRSNNPDLLGERRDGST